LKLGALFIFNIGFPESVLSDPSEAHGQTEIRPPRVEAKIPAGYLMTHPS
jgi:hypothetical protein